MAGEIGLEGQPRPEEWVVVAANNIDQIAVDVGRPGHPALAQEFERRFGQRDIHWRVTEKQLEHNGFGGFAKAFGFVAVQVEVSVDALEHENKIWDRVSLPDFEKGLLNIML